jgi:hypothetical protein
VLHELTIQNTPQRMALAECTQNDEVSCNNVWFSDEAHFHLDGVVNKQNVRFWASENPRVIHEKVHRAPRTTAWFSISRHGLLGTVNSERYFSMFRNPFVPRLLAINLRLHTQWFMQDGARPHTPNVLDFRLACHLKPVSWSCCMWTELI